MSNPENTVPPESAHTANEPFAAAARKVMERCEVLGGISDAEGRITRTFLSPATHQAHSAVAGWMREAGLAVHFDAAGNLVGRREASRANPATDGKTFVIGSHLDTVPNAGKFDGVLGVMAGIAIAALTQDTPFPFALEVVGFSEEEGVRFGKPYIGSHAFAGTLPPEWLGLCDQDGVSVSEAIRTFGFAPEPLKTLRPRSDLLGYFEIHIEQGPVLEEKNVAVGIVSAIAAQTRMMLEVVGSASHAGTTPMQLRKDALACAAEMIFAIDELTGSRKSTVWAPIQGVATVGKLEVHPNATNVVPGRVHFSLDVRHATDEAQQQAIATLLHGFQAIAHQRGVQFTVLERTDFPATPMRGSLPFLADTHAFKDAKGIDHVKQTWKRSDIPSVCLSSGAGHDAAILAQVCPAAMMFIRSPGGISHSPLESVLLPDIRIALKHACIAVEALAENPISFLSAMQESK